MNDPAERLVENKKAQSFPHKQIQRHLSVRHGQKDEKGDKSRGKTEKNVLKKTAFGGRPIQQAPGAKQFIIYPYPASQSHGIQQMQQLGFSAITMNSMDGVSDRDFCIELASALSIMMMHLSRFCEEIILWSSHEFHFVELSDAYSTGSSIMPQKKNPDMAELIRGKTGRVYGHLMQLLTTMKGLPLAYNKDMQEDKEGLFDAIDTVKMCLPVFTNMIATMTVKKDAMLNAAKGGFTNATDAADWLVKQGVPFRDAHEIIGKLVLYCIEHNTNLDDLSLEEYKAISPVFDDSVYAAINVNECAQARKVVGGPAKEATTVAIENNKKFFDTI